MPALRQQGSHGIPVRTLDDPVDLLCDRQMLCRLAATPISRCTCGSLPFQIDSTELTLASTQRAVPRLQTALGSI